LKELYGIRMDLFHKQDTDRTGLHNQPRGESGTGRLAAGAAATPSDAALITP
jgi:hypothetical protein